jgi:hypothetical protein
LALPGIAKAYTPKWALKIIVNNHNIKGILKVQRPIQCHYRRCCILLIFARHSNTVKSIITLHLSNFCLGKLLVSSVNECYICDYTIWQAYKIIRKIIGCTQTRKTFDYDTERCDIIFLFYLFKERYDKKRR